MAIRNPSQLERYKNHDDKGINADYALMIIATTNIHWLFVTKNMVPPARIELACLAASGFEPEVSAVPPQGDIWYKEPMTHTNPMPESAGEFTAKSTCQAHCRQCNKTTPHIYEKWESSCGGYEDYKYECTICGGTFWVDGIDS